MAKIHVPGIQTRSLNPSVIFETDFSADTSYTQGGGVLIETSNVPNGWDGVRVTPSGGTGSIDGVSGGGKNGSDAIRLKWDETNSQPTTQMFKHLTGNENTGYSDLYIRYHFKLPDGFRCGSSSQTAVSYWKWGRLWQNTGTTNDGSWSENRTDSKYAVWNFSGTNNDNSPVYPARVRGAFGANSGSKLNLGSAGGERYAIRVNTTGNADVTTVKGAYLETMVGSWASGGDIPSGQGWHTIEYHFQLSDGVTYGLFEVWLDGVRQDGWGDIQAQDGASALSPDPTGNHAVIPTEVDGSGWNMFVFFDNMTEWNDEWDAVGVEGYIDITDVCVATTRIGHSYVVTGDGS